MRAGYKKHWVWIHRACFFFLQRMSNFQKARTAARRARARYQKKRTKKNKAAYISALLALTAVGVAIVASGPTKRVRNRRKLSRAANRVQHGKDAIAHCRKSDCPTCIIGKCKPGFRKDTNICPILENGPQNHYCVKIPDDNKYCYNPCGKHCSTFNRVVHYTKISNSERQRRLREFGIACARCGQAYYSASGTTTICPDCR